MTGTGVRLARLLVSSSKLLGLTSNGGNGAAPDPAQAARAQTQGQGDHGRECRHADQHHAHRDFIAAAIVAAVLVPVIIAIQAIIRPERGPPAETGDKTAGRN